MREDLHFITAWAENFSDAVKQCADSITQSAHIAEPQRYMLAAVSEDDELHIISENRLLESFGFDNGLRIEDLSSMMQVWIEEDVIGYVTDFLDKTTGQLTRPVSNRRYLEAISPCGLRVMGNYLVSAAGIKTFRRDYGDAEADVLNQDFNAFEFSKYGLTNLAVSEGERSHKKFVVVIKTIL